MGERSSLSELPTDRTAAVTQLFNVHYTHLVRTARLLVDDKETAEDVVMDAFTSLHRRWTAIREPDEAYRYLRSCVLNGARSRLRRRRLSRLHESVLPAEPATGEDLAMQGTDRTAVMQLLRALPVRQRQVLVMRYFLDLSEAEIADELRISPGSVKTHASRGIAALGRALEVSR
ncbi:MAG: SigE family RNA polymerase sigma factor [Actinomycetes bacterium]